MANAKNVLVKYELEDKQEKSFVVPRSAAEVQRYKLEKLLKKSASNNNNLTCKASVCAKRKTSVAKRLQ